MVVTAKQFQSVLDVVKKWHDQGFRDRLVNGQFALVDTEDYILKYTFTACCRKKEEACALNYILKYTSKACPLNYEAVFEQQSRGMQHFH